MTRDGERRSGLGLAWPRPGRACGRGPGERAAEARLMLRGRLRAAERSPRHLYSPQAILAAQRRGEDVETSKKCGYPAAWLPRQRGGEARGVRPGGRRSPAAVRCVAPAPARPTESLLKAVAWKRGGQRAAPPS